MGKTKMAREKEKHDKRKGITGIRYSKEKRDQSEEKRGRR
jgi:hypothetical protein